MTEARRRSVPRRVAAVVAVVALLSSLPALLTGCGEEDVRRAAEEVETRAREAGEQIETRARGAGEEARTRVEEQFGRLYDVVDPDHDIALTNFVCPFDVEGASPDPGQVIAMVEIELTNTDDRQIELGPGDFKLETDDGQEYSAATGIGGEDALKGDTTIAPGETLKRQLFFEVPEGRKAPYLIDEIGIEPLKIEIPGQR